MASIGIDFGGTSVKIGVCKGSRFLEQPPRLVTADYRSPDDLIEAMRRVILDLKSRYPEIEAVGVGVPGFVDFRTGMVHKLTNVEGWVKIPLKEILTEGTGLTVTVENDANAMAYAEWRLGAGMGSEHMLA
ncbi:MAG: ROK family protein, partial [Verrucomicrobiota bacterium]